MTTNEQLCCDQEHLKLNNEQKKLIRHILAIEARAYGSSRTNKLTDQDIKDYHEIKRKLGLDEFN